MTTLTLPDPVDDPALTRISFRQPVTRDGFMDGGWWPRSDDLQAEAPALLEALWTAGREITRISYHLDRWRPAPRRLTVGGRRVHLAGYHWQNPLLVSLSDARHNDTIDLLVVAHDTEPDEAERLLRLASESGNDCSPAELVELAHAGPTSGKTPTDRCAP